jgi:D-beta-D-heptose 7-phosphate kinase/D-beta-D-heptose 1-phosphate adenosyltransferase
MLRTLEAQVDCVGVVGAVDSEAALLRDLLEREGIGLTGVLGDVTRSTSVKQRFWARSCQSQHFPLLRVDRESTALLHSPVEDQAIEVAVRFASQVQAVLVPDYGKGVCTPRLVHALIQHAQEHKLPLLIDPARGANYERYRGATLVKPNRKEAGLATAMAIATPDEAILAARLLCQSYALGAVVVTLDYDGMVYAAANGQSGHVPLGRRCSDRSVIDITGAGDAVLAMLGLCLASGIELPVACLIANAAGQIEVAKAGCSPITRQEVTAHLLAQA